MITIECSCGTVFEVPNEEEASRLACPGCGTLAADLLALAASQSGGQPAEPVTTEQVFIPCGNHPDQRATHNCLNCAKPLCMDCVRARGYFCSDACRDTVKAQTPTMTDKAHDAELEAFGAKVDNIGSSVAGVLRKLVVPTVVIIVAVIGFATYKKFFGPRGRLTATMGISSRVAQFKVKAIAPDRAIVQANDELFLADLSNQKRVWTVSLPKFEKPYTPPPGTARRPSEFDFEAEPGEPRDALEFTDVQGGHVLVHSRRQLLGFDAPSGKMQWEYFAEDGFVVPVAWHDGGLVCSVSRKYVDEARPRLVSFGLADGSQAWSQTNVLAQAVVANGRLVSVVAEPRPRTNVAGTTEQGEPDEEEVPTAGSVVLGPGGKISAKEILAAAQGKTVAPNLPKANYIVQFVSLDGRSTSRKTLALAGWPKPHVLGKILCLVAGPDLVAFEKGPEPLWQTTLGGAVELIAAGGDLTVVQAGDDLVALEVRTGKPRWTRNGLKAIQLAVGADSAVFATMEMPKGQAGSGDAARFREAAITTTGKTLSYGREIALLKLDATSGQTRWGVKNIGRDLVVTDKELYTFDRAERQDLIGSQDLVAIEHAVHCLAPSNGKDRWSYIARGDLHHHEVIGQKVFLVTAQEAPTGRHNPACNYQLQLVECK